MRFRALVSLCCLALLAGAGKALALKQADLSVEGMTVSNRGRPGQALSVRVEIENRGAIEAKGSAQGGGGYLVDVVLSRDAEAPVRPATLSASFREDGLLEGGRFARTVDLGAHRRAAVSSVAVRLPADVPPGGYQLCAVVDPGNVVRESDESNNTLCVPFEVVAGSSTSASAGPPVVTTRAQLVRVDAGALAAASKPKAAAPKAAPTVASIDSDAVASATSARTGSAATGEPQPQSVGGSTPTAVGSTGAVATGTRRDAEVGGASAETVAANRKLDVHREKRQTVATDRKLAVGISRPAAIAGSDAPAVPSPPSVTPGGLAEDASRARLCPSPTTLLGRVVDGAGVVVWGTSVEVWRQSERAAAMATELGHFRFDGLCPGGYELRVPANTGELVRNHADAYFRPLALPIDLPAAGAEVDLELSSHRVSVRGQVTPWGEPSPSYRELEVTVGSELVTSALHGTFEARVDCCGEIAVAPRPIEGFRIVPKRRIVRLSPNQSVGDVDFQIWIEEVYALGHRGGFVGSPPPPLDLEGVGVDAGPGMILMPDFVEHPTFDARRYLQVAGWPAAAIELEYEEVRDITQIDKVGIVARQEPAAGQRIIVGTQVKLVSRRIDPNYRNVPDLVGQRIEEAQATLREWRIPNHVDDVNHCPPEELRSSRIDRCRAEEGIIVRQSPAAGIHPEATVIELAVGRLPAPRAVPDAVEAWQLLRARSVLKSAGFITRFRTDRVRMSSDCTGMEVNAQSPVAGAIADYGSVVTLDVCFHCSSSLTAATVTVREGACDLGEAMRFLTEELGYPPLNGYLN